MRKRSQAISAGVDQSAVCDDRQFVTALHRGLEVLRAFRPEDQGGLSNQQLSKRTGMPNSTLSRLTFTLMQSGYLTYDAASGRYSLGAPVLSLGYACLSGLPFRSTAQTFMQSLANDCGDGMHVALASRVEDTMIFLAVARATGVVSVQLDVGTRVSIANSAVGRAYLASCDDRERAAFIEDLKSRLDEDAAKAQIDGITRAMEEIAFRGFCTDFGAWRQGVNSVAVPFRSRHGNSPLQAFVLGGPATHATPEGLIDDCGPRLVEHCHTLSFAEP